MSFEHFHFPIDTVDIRPRSAAADCPVAGRIFVTKDSCLPFDSDYSQAFQINPTPRFLLPGFVRVEYRELSALCY